MSKAMPCAKDFFLSFFYSHPIDENSKVKGVMDGMFETYHLPGYKKNKTPPSVGFKVQGFPAALPSGFLPSGFQVGEGNRR
jgi:hypothetical protein